MCGASPQGMFSTFSLLPAREQFLSGCGPHFSFVLSKEKSPPQRWKRKALGHQTARRALFAYDTGVPARDLGRSNQSQRWAKAPVLAISISLASGLRRKLAHSDARPLSTKTALLGFHRGPDLAETFGPSARDGLLSCGVGCKPDLTCFFPPLPLCQLRIGRPATSR